MPTSASHDGVVAALVVSRPWGPPRGARRRSGFARRQGSPGRPYCRPLRPEQRRRPTLVGKRIDSVHRYYDPTTGQFLSVDPLADMTGTPYAFTGGDPVNGSDPAGLGPICVLGVCLGFHPGNAVKGLANFGAGIANFVVSSVTAGHVHVPAPFCGGLLGISFDIGNWTGFAETGLAGGGLGGAEADAGSVAASTGRTEAANLAEQLAMEAARADPAAGRILPVEMTDARWPASAGWVKMAQNNIGVEVHYVFNTITHDADDFKFVP